MNILKSIRPRSLGQLFSAFRFQSTIAPGSALPAVGQRDDSLIQNLKSATSSQQVLQMVQHEYRNMNLQHILHSLKSLFALQKNGLSSLKDDDLLHHPDFELLCDRLKYKCRSIEINDIVEVLKVLTFLNAPPNSDIFNVFLNLLRKEINQASLMHIVFLDYLFNKIDPTKNAVLGALKMSFPILFEVNVDKQIDHDNVPQLIDLLAFVCRNRVNKKSSMCVVNALLIHGENFQFDEAIKIAWSLCDNKSPSTPQFEKLFTKAFNSLTRNIEHLKVDQIEITISKMSRKYSKYPTYIHEGFLNAVSEYLVRNNVDFQMCCFLMKPLNKMSFVNLKLIHYLLGQFYKDPSLLSNGRPSVVLSMLNACSNANYTYFSEENYRVFSEAINSNPLLESNITGFPWIKVACEMASLNIFNQNLANRLFSDQFLDEYMSRKSTIDYLQLGNLFQSYKLLSPFENTVWPSTHHLEETKNIVISRQNFAVKTPLEYAFGGQDYVATKVLSKYYHLIDHVLQFNEKNDICKLPQTIPNDDGYVELEDILSSGQAKTVAVLVFPKTYYTTNLKTIKGTFNLHIETLRKMDLIPVVIDLELWTKLPDIEKIPFLQREIKSNL